MAKKTVDAHKPRTAGGYGRFHPQQNMMKDSSGIVSENAGLQLNSGVLSGNII